jgi:hypothetical protein
VGNMSKSQEDKRFLVKLLQVKAEEKLFRFIGYTHLKTKTRKK